MNASKLQLATHMVSVLELWLQKEGANVEEPAEYFQRLLVSMPTEPEGPLVRVRSKIADLIEEDSPILRNLDGENGFFARINNYAESQGVKEDIESQGVKENDGHRYARDGLHAMQDWSIIDMANKCKSSKCLSWVCGKLSPDSCLCQADSTFPIEDVPAGPKREYVRLARGVNEQDPEASLLLDAMDLRRALKPKVQGSLAHMTKIVGGKDTEQEAELDAWLNEHNVNGHGFFVLGDVGRGGKMEMDKDAEMSNSAKQDYQTPMLTHFKRDPALDPPMPFGDDRLLSPKEALSKFKAVAAAQKLTPNASTKPREEAASKGGALTQKMKQVQSLLSLARVTSAASELAEYFINLPKSQLATMLLAIYALGPKFKPAISSFVNLIVSAAFKLGAEPLDSTRQRLRALFVKFMNAVSKSLQNKA